jgi:hypothetical protein
MPSCPERASTIVGLDRPGDQRVELPDAQLSREGIDDVGLRGQLQFDQSFAKPLTGLALGLERPLKVPGGYHGGLDEQFTESLAVEGGTRLACVVPTLSLVLRFLSPSAHCLLPEWIKPPTAQYLRPTPCQL